MEVFIDAAINPTRFYSQQLIRRVSSQYDINNPDLEERIMAVIDYISGMTDIYALDIYQKINGISLPIVWFFGGDNFANKGYKRQLWEILSEGEKK